jgi:NAD(P)-dependent dehydrogenase (short-subunit alcohol dehydrogenase family)
MDDTSPTNAAHFSLAGKVAVITGGSRGLGRAIGFGFARAGASVVIASRDERSCIECAEEIERETGQVAVAVPVHVGQWDQLDGFVATINDRLERIDVLVNNAGMSPLYESLEGVTEELFDKVVDVNLKGPFRLSALVGRQMYLGQGGSIINISSAGAVHPRPDIVPYAAAKAAVNAMTVGFARALGPKVRCNAIMAGTFLTDVSKSWDQEAFRARAETFALRRGARPEEIVGTAIYLASDASSYTTGSIITVDGGQP